jgi:cholesterol oxidase
MGTDGAVGEFDFDYVIVGSGFGGSVSAMRLTEKGYSVGVLEQGKRYRAEDFPKTNWAIWKWVWMPKLFCYGIQRLTLLKEALVLAGAGVGGGSLVYANTLLVPPDEVFDDPQWKDLADWRTVLKPHYAEAKRMLGVVENCHFFESDRLLQEYAKEIGREHTWHPTDVGVYFGEPDIEVPDPYFGGKGPARRGCNFCGGCMVGCRYRAKNTLDYNYLYFAEAGGAKVFPETRVTLIRPVEGGYEIDTQRTTGFLFKRGRTFRARGVVMSAGVLGTVPLLLECRDRGALPNLPRALGQHVRTNSEAILGASAWTGKVDYAKGIAITSGLYVDDVTHVEVVRYPKKSDAMGSIANVLTDGGGRVPRFLKFMLTCLLHPLAYLRSLVPFGWAKRSIILLVMQTVNNFMTMIWKRRWYWPFTKTFSTQQVGDAVRVPAYIPRANAAARWFAKKIGGYPASTITEALLDVPTTAHILGGCVMGTSPETGVIDTHNRVYGYDNFYVVDGSMVGANLGVNPSLTITALAEHAMSQVAPKAAAAGPHRAVAADGGAG